MRCPPLFRQVSYARGNHAGVRPRNPRCPLGKLRPRLSFLILESLGDFSTPCPQNCSLPSPKCISASACLSRVAVASKTGGPLSLGDRSLTHLHPQRRGGG